MSEKENIAKMEKLVVGKPYPKDKGSDIDTSAFVKKGAEKVIILSSLLLFVCALGSLIFSGSRIRDKDGSQKEGNAPVLEGFELLRDQKGYDEAKTEEKDAEITGVQNAYFVTPQIENAYIIDSMVQLKNKTYKLPVSLSTLEEDGISLVVLGVQPPDESVVLEPNYRNGFIQVDAERYSVYLKNGADCMYHDLTVYGIYVDGESGDAGKAFYSASGLTIGSPEAAIAKDADKIEQDMTGEHTYYSFGTAEKVGMSEAYHGKTTQYTTKDGIITAIWVLDDGSVK